MAEKHTRQSIMADLQAIGVNPGGTLLVHSSMKAVGECENGGDTVIDALIAYMRDGLLVLPTHTWSAIGENKPIYDPQTEPSCVGILGMLLLKRPGVVRSLHPTHSVAAVGIDAAAFVAGEELTKTACARQGCYGKLYDRNAQILFMGCDLSKNTFLHGVEEWNDIPNRLMDTPQALYVKTPGGLIACPQHRHIGDVSRNYIKMEKVFVKTGACCYGKIGDAHSVLGDAVKMADLVSAYLKKDPDLFATDRALDI